MRIEDNSGNLIIDFAEAYRVERKEKTILKRFYLALFPLFLFLVLLSPSIVLSVAQDGDATPPKIRSTYPYDGLTVAINDFNEINAYIQEAEGTLTSIKYYDSFVPEGIELLPVVNVTKHPMWMPDLNKDGRVDDTEIYEVHIAFGSRPGDINWNPDADAYFDGVINVLDMLMVKIWCVKIWYGTGTYAAIHPCPSAGTVHFVFIAEDDAGNQAMIAGTFTIIGPTPVGGYALPIKIDIDASNSMFPHIGLAPVLLAAMAVTIILIRRRNKN